MIKELSPNETAIIVSTPVTEIPMYNEVLQCFLLLASQEHVRRIVPGELRFYARELMTALKESSHE